MRFFLIICLLISEVAFSQSINPGNKVMRKVAQVTKVLIEDIVYRVEVHEKGRKVLFSKHSGIYYLRSDSKHFTSILAALEKSRESGESIKVQADSDNLEIEELVLSTK